MCTQNIFVNLSFSINQKLHSSLVREIDDFAGDGMGENEGLWHTPNYWAVGMRPEEACRAQVPDSVACKTADQVDIFDAIMSSKRRGDFKRWHPGLDVSLLIPQAFYLVPASAHCGVEEAVLVISSRAELEGKKNSMADCTRQSMWICRAPTKHKMFWTGKCF